MPLQSLDDLFVHFLRDMYYAEKQIVKALPRMARKAESDKLREALEHHLEESQEHVANLEKVFELLDLKPRGVTCEAMDGILDEGKEMMSDARDAETRDAGMIASAQAVEHYEITRYGTLIAWATQLGKDDVLPLLRSNLDQEYAADRKLSELAEKGLNRKAA
ncbi:ferritin-like domain-containing protein [Amaricoccus sp.]|uniref:YciE/YciF ferroxidase family protein n=1 Tax=Amaricoccus sp. TaxID=1872485 RepID=UPI00262DD83F|nr:ferritin-like domain-containing protein [Amaricoccus sp.]HRO10566.1 ferritin-like domain-containing protein [Amaricoccus sp.]